MTVKAKYKVSESSHRHQQEQSVTANEVELKLINALPSTSSACLQNEENKKKIGNQELRGSGGGGSGDPQKGGGKDCEAGIIHGGSGNYDDYIRNNTKEADDLRKGDCGLTEVVVVVPKKKDSSTSIPKTPSGDSTSTTFVDEDQPLSKEEKRIHYKFSKNVMAGRKIRELMNANVRENIRLHMQETQPKSFKICCVAGVAIALQIIVLLLIFI